jgi:hypothetical protein
MNVNLKYVEARNLVFVGDQGSFLVNNMLINGARSYLELFAGEILVQSKNSFRLNYTSIENTICFSGGNIRTVKKSKCAVKMIKQNSTTTTA